MYKRNNPNSSKNGHLLPLFWTFIFLMSLLIAILSFTPIGKAVFVRGGDFEVTLALGERVTYHREDVQLVVNLVNSSNKVRTVNFTGGCQATFSIYTTQGKRAYPRFVEEYPCNNTGYETFLIVPGQKKRYQFKIDNSSYGANPLPVGKYNVVGFVDGFGRTDPLSLEIVPRPNPYAREGELCEGLTGKICGEGLECRHTGGFPLGAGMCFMKYDVSQPRDRCSQDARNCFDDVYGHPHEDVIDKFAVLDRINGFDDHTFRPDSYIEVDHFERLVSDVSGKVIDIQTSDKYVRRETAIEVLYKAFVSDRYPRNLSCPFVDISRSKKSEYITAAYKIGVLEDYPGNRFRPSDFLTRAEAVYLVDRFENN